MCWQKRKAILNCLIDNYFSNYSIIDAHYIELGIRLRRLTVPATTLVESRYP
jgi:hypothetical protein